MNKHSLKIHSLIIISLIILFPFIGKAQSSHSDVKRPERKSVPVAENKPTPVTENKPAPVVESKSVPVVENKSTLVADKVTKNPSEALATESELMDFTLEIENYAYPADELYEGKWNNEYVKAYADLELPDSLRIDVSGFVIPCEGRVTSKYGPRKRRFHHGIDLKLQTGDTVRAAFDGKVRVKKYERKGYGYYVVLRHPNGLETVYGHFSKFLVEEGQYVKAGQPIGLGGNTGRSRGSHLHLEFRLLGQSINPEEIVDFQQHCTFDDSFVFDKRKVNLKTKTYAYGYSSSASPDRKKATNTYTETPVKQEKKAPEKKASTRYHKVKDGDTLGAIARRYGTTVNKLCSLNKINSTTTLRVGKSLRIS